MEIIEFHSTFSRHGNAQASLTLLIWLNEKVQKLSLKIIQKLIRVRRSAHLFLECPSGRNLTESIQNQTESWGCMPDGILRGHAAREKTVQTEPKEQREQCELAQALPSRV